MKMYAVNRIRKDFDAIIGIADFKLSLCYAKGMEGVIPIFKKRKDAEVYLDSFSNKLTIIEIEINN